MRFRLLEDNNNQVANITPQMLDAWKSGNTTTRERIIRQIMNNMSGGSKELYRLENAFRKSCLTFGIDTDDNPFIMFLNDLVRLANVDKKHDEHACALVDLVFNKVIPKERLEAISNG